MREGEHDLQVTCVQLFRWKHRELAGLLFAIPNGGQRNAVVAAKLKAEGVTAGVPDLLLAVMRGGYGGLFVEMKNGKAGRVSDAQVAKIEELRAAGYKVEICRNSRDFEEVVEKYLRM